ncbi:hypothetical protein MHYP_G00336280 [Metynnis hypsauchen]
MLGKQQRSDSLNYISAASGPKCQDNDPKHTSRLCKGYLTKKESDGVLRQMTWPPQSPDLNPIEMVWGKLDRRVKAKGPTSAKHLWELLQDCWKLFQTYDVFFSFINGDAQMEKRLELLGLNVWPAVRQEGGGSQRRMLGFFVSKLTSWSNRDANNNASVKPTARVRLLSLSLTLLPD